MAAAGGAAPEPEPEPEPPRRGPAAEGEGEDEVAAEAEQELAAELAARRSAEARRLVLSPRRLSGPLPAGLSQWFPALEVLDVSGTGLAELGAELLALPRLHTLLAKNNRLGGPGSLPKGLGQAPLGRSLRVLNLSGNRFAEVPPALLGLRGLQSLSLGGNRLHGIPPEIQELRSLEFLYLGGNFITSIPPELANLPSLNYLVLCDNKIQSIPPQLAQLHSLRSLSLHNNLLTYLPREIINLVHLEELSLRGNPLVVRFVRDLTYNPPSLQELAGRTIKTRNVPYAPSDLPENLVRYLSLASNCPNPKCGDVSPSEVFSQCFGISPLVATAAQHRPAFETVLKPRHKCVKQSCSFPLPRGVRGPACIHPLPRHLSAKGSCWCVSECRYLNSGVVLKRSKISI
ncbi:leucine-rich repeat-containing protein 58-like isoform X2 [Calonectris borealis]|uniref:leucine-rich repeat-containing protein 58-like isoform X2 n=1 Tax=Calonectris borealis TaxID=1323832 RepID=UPI003F4C8B35